MAAKYESSAEKSLQDLYPELSKAEVQAKLDKMNAEYHNNQTAGTAPNPAADAARYKARLENVDRHNPELSREDIIKVARLQTEKEIGRSIDFPITADPMALPDRQVESDISTDNSAPEKSATTDEALTPNQKAVQASNARRAAAPAPVNPTAPKRRGFRSSKPQELSAANAAAVPGASLNKAESKPSPIGAKIAPSSDSTNPVKQPDPNTELSRQQALTKPGNALNGEKVEPKKMRSAGLDKLGGYKNPENSFGNLTPEQQIARRAEDPNGKAPEDDRFASAGEEAFFHNAVNPDKSERKNFAKTGSAAPFGKLAPKNGEYDPEKFGGTPMGKHEGKKSPAGVAAAGGKRIANYMRRHPKGAIYGIGALVVAALSVVGFIISLPFQLIHIAQVLFDHNFGPGEKQEQTASRRVIARLMLEKAAKPATGAKQNTGRPLADKIANMKMDRFNKMLARDNLKLEFDAKTGRLTGIKNTLTGEVLKDFSDASFLERRQAIGNLVSERIAPWRVLKRVKYTKLMRFHARVSFQFWPKEKVDDLKKVATEKIRQGASAEELAKARGTADPPASEVDGSTSDETLKAVEEEFTKTGNKTSAIKAGISKMRSAKFFGITGALAMVCFLRDLANNAAEDGYIQRTEQLMRVGNMVQTQVSQLATGKGLDMDKFGQTMDMWTGDQRAAKDSIDAKSWDQSAAAHRINGENIDTRELVNDKPNPSYTPDLPEGSNPDGFMLQKIMDRVNEVFSAVPGANFVCKALSGIFGYIIQGIELASAIITGGAEAAAAAAIQAIVQGFLFIVVVPKILAAAANLAVTGTENAVDMFNNADAGTLLSAMDYQRSYGGRQMSDNERVAVVEESRQQDLQIAREKGWTYRTFALSNTNSLASQVLMKVPTRPNTMVAAITNLPKTLSANLGAIFMGGVRPAYAAADDPNPYNFQYYGFTKEEIDKYPDFLANEAYLTQAIPGTTETRLSMLGDPTDYSPDDGDDPDMNNLHHCFVNKFRSPSELEADPICKGIGAVTGRGKDVKNYKSGSATNNPGADAIVRIYRDNGVNLPAGDDFLRYRLHLLYDHIVAGLECASNDEPCLQGKGISNIATAPTNGGATPTGDVKSLAAQILANGNVTYWTNKGVNTKDVFIALAAGNPAYTTCGNANGAKPAVNPNILKFILESASQTKIMVNALTDKCHTDGSNHYSGEAVDLERTVGSLAVFNRVAAKYGGTKNTETSHHHFDFPK